MSDGQQQNSVLFGSNIPFVEEQYEIYLQNPNGVDPSWRRYFDQLPSNGLVKTEVAHTPIIQKFAQIASSKQVTYPRLSGGVDTQKQADLALLALRYRVLGLKQAVLDPLNRLPAPHLPELDPASYGFSSADLDLEITANPIEGMGTAKLKDILTALQETYCGTVGLEYMYIADTLQRVWLQKRFESIRSKPSYTPEIQRQILERLTAAETFERYLHTKYVGQKRFSGEGSETLIPMLDRLLQKAGSLGVQECVLGMAHRGRLNVLVNTLGKMPSDLFQEFEGKYTVGLSAGDVKYHQGFSSDITTPGGPMHLTLAFNPSHLEIVNPVVEGSVRARQYRRGDQAGDQVLPILIHGDAAIAGQGVVMETLNLSQTRGYGTGGTIHIIINNQIGFTTSDPRDARGTTYCSDVAKMIDAPIFHVNADDPEAAVMVTEIAMEFRKQFHKDVVIDLICFRRLGHNEQDEPMVTQPLMYSKIAQHPGTRKLYADRLIQEGIVRADDPEQMVANYRAILDQGKSTNTAILSNYQRPQAVNWEPYQGRLWTEPAVTGVTQKILQALGKVLVTVPQDFKLHPRVEKIIADRAAMVQGKQSLDWGMAENLAYASLLVEGHAVRLSGQDCGRGTFFHRHAVWHDQNRESWDRGAYLPLQNLQAKQADFIVIDSVLSEEAVLGFEYGYATSDPNQLVIWEAQFGDFVNGAQVVIDQFLCSGEAKWGRLCGLVLLLPHGYEGQGPEHSSGRPERFLQLCAEDNMQVVVPSTPAQIFHLLRRQMLRPFRKPLIVFTPKSLLRHKEAVSSLQELAEGGFQTVIGDAVVSNKAAQRLILCSGKVYYDLIAFRREQKIMDTAIVRLEQQYPFPSADLQAIIRQYPQLKSVVWCQEEPQNQGAWHMLRDAMQACLPESILLQFAGRPASASPAVGYHSKHVIQQQELVAAAFAQTREATKTKRVAEKVA